MTTTAERRHLAAVAALPCACCDASGPSIVHHIRDGQGMSQRASHWLTVALCPDCHTGHQGVHGDKTLMRIRKLSELDLLAITLRRLA